MSPRQLITLFCAAEMSGMAAYAGFFAQVPTLAAEWRLTAVQIGFVSGAFYAGYMLAVPILVTLTDHRDPRRIYLSSMLASALGAVGFAMLADGMVLAALFHALSGVGLAGTYMPGLRLLTDRLQGLSRSRAVAVYTGSYAVGTAGSFLLIGGLSHAIGWRWAFGLAAGGPLLASIGMAVLCPADPSGEERARLTPAIFDFRAVLANPAVMARAIAYAAHNFELFGLWSWAVAFLAFAYAQRPADRLHPDEAVVGALLTLMLLPASVAGNEIAARVGARRWIIGVMTASAMIASVLGFLPGQVPTGLVVVLCIAYGIATAAESGTLTASVVAAAEPRYRGMTMAAYSMIGFGGSCAGPMVFGLVLQLAGAGRVAGWGAAFLAMGAGALTGPLALVILDRRARRAKDGGTAPAEDRSEASGR